jgi:molybdopterin/thiamine biosynthesis adenylyltransferase
MSAKNIIIIGLGGVGSILSGHLCRFLNFSSNEPVNVLLVDGDEYEDKNFERQEFTRVGRKADIKATELSMKFDKLEIDALEEYITDENVSEVINEDSVVFMCVDNHKTRMIVSNYCKTMNNVTLISGGNEFTDGNAQLYVRKDGHDLTPDLCMYHPEIANPEDKLPTEMSCEELSVSEPQLGFTNLGVAFQMCCMFYNSVMEVYERSEVYFDILSMNANSKVRIVK